MVIKEVIDHKRTIKDVLDTHPQWPPVPPKDPKEVVEVPGPGGAVDPVAQVADRVSRLEVVVHRRAFISPEERPGVG
jgi:hypothetical protein